MGLIVAGVGTVDEEQGFLLGLFRVLWGAEAGSDLEWGYTDAGLLRFAVNCSDLFYWATADVEYIDPADLPLLRTCAADLAPYGEDHWVSELFACRKRGMRPHQPCYKNWPPEVAALFDACGPVRDRASEG